MYFTTIENSHEFIFLQKFSSWIRIRMDPHSFYLLDPDSDPHSEKLLDQDPQKMNADPQPCEKVNFFFFFLLHSETQLIVFVCRVVSEWWRTGSVSCRCGAWSWSRPSTSGPGSSMPASAASPTASSSPTRPSSPSWEPIPPPIWTFPYQPAFPR